MLPELNPATPALYHRPSDAELSPDALRRRAEARIRDAQRQLTQTDTDEEEVQLCLAQVQLRQAMLRAYIRQQQAELAQLH